MEQIRGTHSGYGMGGSEPRKLCDDEILPGNDVLRRYDHIDLPIAVRDRDLSCL